MAFWELVQQNSDRFLTEGLHRILMSEDVTAYTPVPNSGGVFIFLLNDTGLYADCASDLKKAFHTERDERYSDFYARYRRTGPDPLLPITKFSLRFCATPFGRLELMTHARADLRTPLTPPDPAYRNQVIRAGAHDLWDRIQGVHFDLVAEGAEKCLQSEPTDWDDRSRISSAGVLLMHSEDGQLLFVDESDNLAASHQRHGTTGAASGFRRAVGERHFGYQLQPMGNQTACFTTAQEEAITGFIRTCSVTVCPIRFGRAEVADYLNEHKEPVLSLFSAQRLFSRRPAIPGLLKTRNRKIFG